MVVLVLVIMVRVSVSAPAGNYGQVVLVSDYCTPCQLWARLGGARVVMRHQKISRTILVLILC